MTPAKLRAPNRRGGSHTVKPNRRTFAALAGKSTFAADTVATATRIVQGASGLARSQARNQTVGSNTYCNLGSIAYPAVASIV